LDDYQTVTGNEIIVMIEACYSGAFAQQLTDARFRRAFITSTNDTVAYFDRDEKQGFSRFFANGLDQGKTFKEAFDSANEEQQKLLGEPSRFTTGSATEQSQSLTQVPQFYDGYNGEWLATHYLNNLSNEGKKSDNVLIIESTTTSGDIPVG